jgi:ssDNA-binding Zn-finger/Zn-ribbon topoisomerase 1
MDDILCPECGAPMILRSTDKFKHRDGSPRKFYGCSRFPDCRATHGAHPNGRPMGTPANAETKEARCLAHEAFDPLWKSGKMERANAYLWLAEQMGIPFGDCHIGNFSKEQCERVVELCAEN